jgi:hypothetical protein
VSAGSSQARLEAAAHSFYHLVAGIVAEAGWLSADPAVGQELRTRCQRLTRRYGELLNGAHGLVETVKPE